MIMITVILMLNVMIIKNKWMNDENNNTTINLCGNKTVIIIEIIKILLITIMIIMVIIIMDNINL